MSRTASTGTRRNLRHALKSFIPIWLSERAGFSTAYKVLFACALVADICIERTLWCARAALPGLGAPGDALTQVGQARALFQGPRETAQAFSARCANFLQMYNDWGSDATLASLVQNYMSASGNLYTVQVIDHRGHFTTVGPTGAVTVANDPSWGWDTNASTYTRWDGTSDDHSQFSSSMYIVIYVNDGYYGPTGFTSLGDLNFIAYLNSKPTYGPEGTIPFPHIQGLLNVIAGGKAAHEYIESIVFTNDPLAFVPGALSNFPDGTWFTGSAAFATSANNYMGTQSPHRPSKTPAGGWLAFLNPYQGG